MKRRHLKIYMSVYEHLNMTSAAEELFISQPSVSQVIRELEKYYEVRLFERYPKRLYPTSEGDLLYKYARQIIGLFDEVEKEIRLVSEQGAVSVGANISAGTVLLTHYIDRFHEQYPGIEVDVRVTGSAKLTRMIYDHDIDFALMEDLVRESNLIQTPFYSDRIVFVTAADHPLAGRKQLRFEDFADESMLLREKGVGVRDKFDLLMNLRDIPVEPAWQSSNTRALINAAKAGYGVAVLPYLLVSQEIRNGSLAELDVREADLHRNLNIVYHKDKVFSKWASAFMDIVRKAELKEEDL